MLKWQRNGLRPQLPKRYSLLTHLFFFSTIVHCCLLSLFFFLHNDSPIILDLQKCNRDLPIVLVPLVKSIPVNQQRTVPGAVNQSSLPAPASKSKTVFKQEPTKKVAQKAKTKQVAKKEIKKVAHKKNVVQSPPKLKEVVEQITKKSITDVVPTNSSALPAANESDVLYVGRDDYDNLMRYKEAHDAITQHWQPPVGIPATTQCTLKIAIDKSGVVKNVDVVQSSQILVYDSAARRALTNAIFPKSLHNKTMIITFNQ